MGRMPLTPQKIKDLRDAANGHLLHPGDYTFDPIRTAVEAPDLKQLLDAYETLQKAKKLHVQILVSTDGLGHRIPLKSLVDRYFKPELMRSVAHKLMEEGDVYIRHDPLTCSFILETDITILKAD